MTPEVLQITDHNFMDILAQGKKEFPLQYYVDEFEKYPGRMIPLHWHPEIEFYVVSGCTLQIQLGQTTITLGEGDGLFINSNVLHSFSPIDSGKSACPNIVFSHELLAPYGSIIYQKYMQDILKDEEIPYILLHPDCPWHKSILSLLDKTFSLLQKYSPPSDFYGQFPYIGFQNADVQSQCYEMEVQALLNKIWQIIYLNRFDIPKSAVKKNNHLLQIRMQKMLAFIHDNYAEPITLQDISGAADISKSEASRCFHSYLRESPISYLLNYRLEKAKNMLHQSDCTILEISEKCGFGSASYFCKIFRRETGITALQYRQLIAAAVPAGRR
ncbi:AraC family transcriptional regulator [Murimonas intestini]|uniref:AraC family transcriptional regulator n=1 Tax=Murimonas intestini TaxID=1337051 RepID=UPI0011DE03E4|nr:AraC family transcriptional regulator [Murimonas intestini]